MGAAVFAGIVPEAGRPEFSNPGRVNKDIHGQVPFFCPRELVSNVTGDLGLRRCLGINSFLAQKLPKIID
jgi:hypothetical protein